MPLERALRFSPSFSSLLKGASKMTKPPMDRRKLLAAAAAVPVASATLPSRVAAHPAALPQAQTPEAKILTLEEFKKSALAPEIEGILGQINGGSFMECHKLVFEATGIWVQELEPVFQRFDAILMTRPIP